MTHIAIIHHLSSSGGTIFSKCIAAQPDVVLLSEVHPLTGMTVPRFIPINPLAHFIVSYPNMKLDEGVLKSQFLARLKPVVEECEKRGNILVLRDHSHSDYLTDLEPHSRLAELLSQHYDLRRLVTFRNPIDAYLSMQASKFDQKLSGFDDYCQRALKFLDDHSDLPLWRYEDFVFDHMRVIGEACAHLGIVFEDAYMSRVDRQKLTGDSGRKPNNIEQLDRRRYSSGFMDEANRSEALAKIGARLGYDVTVSKPEIDVFSTRDELDESKDLLEKRSYSAAVKLRCGDALRRTFLFSRGIRRKPKQSL